MSNPTEPASSTAVEPTAPRQPQQERGRRRVDAILDAAASVIIEEGAGGVTMHRVARLSRTTTGSMYHFFPDREALLRELANRHAANIRELLTRMEQEKAPRWSSLPTADAVDEFLDPVISYIDQHPDLPAVARFAHTGSRSEARDEQLDELVIRLGRLLVESRLSCATEAELTVRAMTVTGMTEGVIGAPVRGLLPTAAMSHTKALRKELRRALVAYLDSHGRQQPRAS